MAAQQVLFAETIAGMKKAFKRKAYESDSDSEIESYSNRGNKLKKRGRFAHKGQLVPTDGPSSYREYVEYNGYQRAIIHRNPPLLDEDGYEFDSDDDEERIQEAEAAAAELNPYANVHLQTILAPLTASTDLPTHPTLSKPFTSKTLDTLVNQSCDIMRKENHSLWQVRHLLTSLCGDYTWVPCSTMVRPSDVELYTDDHVARHLLSLAKGTNGLPESPSPATLTVDSQRENGVKAGTETERINGVMSSDKTVPEDADVAMTDADAPTNPDGDSTENKDEGDKNGNKSKAEKGKNGDTTAKEPEDDAENSKAGTDKDKDGDNPVTNGNPTGEAAETNGDDPGSVTSEQMETFVHPMFIAPVGAKPDRDVGLPEPEAEDMRRLLALYVQKQEEICRGAKKLFLGLLKADKLRKDVLHWSKAEAHSGANRDMSDGEDWYDKEEWGLTEDLKKGQDEEEEDTQTTGKKTRNRK